jgi:hypothetical protein
MKRIGHESQGEHCYRQHAEVARNTPQHLFKNNSFWSIFSVEKFMSMGEQTTGRDEI